jgi:hypothetical protein
VTTLSTSKVSSFSSVSLTLKFQTLSIDVSSKLTNSLHTQLIFSINLLIDEAELEELKRSKLFSIALKNYFIKLY